MISVIGKNPNLSVKGIRPARTLLPKYKQVIGNCSHLFNVTLPFSELTFARDGSEYIRFGNRMIEQPNANIPATINIGGRVFMQSGPALVTINSYSDAIDTQFPVLSFMTVDPNVTTDPLGASVADKLEESTSGSAAHYVQYSPSLVLNSQYVMHVLVKADERDQIVFQNDMTGAPGNYLGQGFDLSLGTTISIPLYVGHEYIWSLITPISDGWYLIAAQLQATLTGSATVLLRLAKELATSYAGVTGYGMYAVAFNLVKDCQILPSYVHSDGAPGAKPKTEPVYAEAVIPTWMRNRFYFEVYTNHYTSAILAIEGGEKHLWSFDAIAGAVRCYIDGADSNKMKVDLVGTGNIITSDALTPTLDGRIRIWFTFDDGANSVLRIIGAGVDAEYTSVQLSAADGDLYWGQREDATLQPSCLISQPEKF